MPPSSLVRPAKPSEAALLECWAPLLPEDVRPIYVTAFGDWFLQGDDGQVLFLDTGTGALDRAAGSRTELRRMLDEPLHRERWLRAGQARLLSARGIVPASGECYSPTPAGDVRIARLDVHQSRMAAAALDEVEARQASSSRLVALVTSLVHLVRRSPAVEPA